MQLPVQNSWVRIGLGMFIEAEGEWGPVRFSLGTDVTRDFILLLIWALVYSAYWFLCIHAFLEYQKQVEEE